MIPKLKRDWVGLRVRSLVPLANGYVRVPAGTLFEVRRNYSGLALLSLPCGACGVQAYMSHVPETAVEIVPKEEA